ncbi:unnamed protein product [Phytophthora lilii]|uniref:Unnamed protein product n=1 Tax=Phytophthora lilii TaxID=2077276 RepID=A0A9W6TFX3_9STRA|nr:unnamed protein product [Phytophthora lilii]
MAVEALAILMIKRLSEELTNVFADIEGSHIASSRNFWVAIATKDNKSSKVVGIIGLDRKSAVIVEVRRVFVDPSYHRMGIGRKLIAHLEDWSKKQGIKHLFLTTSSKILQPHAFYTAVGYTKTDDILLAWENPPYFELCKFVKQL